MTIQILSPELANQIAAGEVVERPASVIKELIENSIDAGANQIDIDIEQGGKKRICIRDNGHGIAREDLALSLARHATSKISSLDDLEAIISLGFRGEALASISSISRLTLTSRTKEQTEAWQVYAEGREMKPIIKPASHPIGTTVEVLDIFYNTPARRRFLKTEKTEFSHIDEVVRRIALASPEVAINFQHNGKLVKQYLRIQNKDQYEKRVAAVCGIPFIQKAIKLQWQHDDLNIYGWVAPDVGTQVQYFYVNHRVVKDRLLLHALKQAFLESNKIFSVSNVETLSYVIYLDIDPYQVDVNVHPAKYEVRFHESRLVHDFVYQAMMMSLEAHYKPTHLTSKQAETTQISNRASAGENIFNRPRCEEPKSAGNTINTPKRYLSTSGKSHSHLNENRIYNQLVDTSNAGFGKEVNIPLEPQAVIESLFPRRTEPFMVQLQSISLAVTFGKVLTIFQKEFALLEKTVGDEQHIFLLSIKEAQKALITAKLLEGKSEDKEQLLAPLLILLDKNEQKIIESFAELLEFFHFSFNFDKTKLQLNSVPKFLRKLNWQQLFPQLIQFLAEYKQESIKYEQFASWLAKQYLLNTETIFEQISYVIQLLADLEQINERFIDTSKFVKPVDLSDILHSFIN